MTLTEKYTTVFSSCFTLAEIKLVHLNRKIIAVTASFSDSFCPLSCPTAKRTCVWPMGRTGRCTLWARSPTFPSWILDSRHTLSSLSAPEREEVVSGQLLSWIADEIASSLFSVGNRAQLILNMQIWPPPPLECCKYFRNSVGICITV